MYTSFSCTLGASEAIIYIQKTTNAFWVGPHHRHLWTVHWLRGGFVDFDSHFLIAVSRFRGQCGNGPDPGCVKESDEDVRIFRIFWYDWYDHRTALTKLDIISKNCLFLFTMQDLKIWRDSPVSDSLLVKRPV